jgi:heme/copper-type cytochrome/quinol oxidase subunit 2
LLVLQDDDDEDLDAPEKRVWYKRPLVWLHVMAFVLALVLFVVGLCSQFLVTSWQVRAQPHRHATKPGMESGWMMVTAQCCS